MNIKTKALTTEQYKEIITTMKNGFCGCRPNERIATALVLEGNLGLRVSDILRLRPCDIVTAWKSWSRRPAKRACSPCRWCCNSISKTIVCAAALSAPI